MKYEELRQQITSVLKTIVRPRGRYSFLAKLKQNCEIFDIGCGNNSPFFIKNTLPSCIYTGIDIVDCDQETLKLADKYIVADQDTFADEIFKFHECFDAVISSHNIEHCNDREKTLAAMLQAVKPRGQLFMAFPSESSVGLPSREGCLNYYDDGTHLFSPPDFENFIRTITTSGFTIEYAAKQYKPFLDWVRGLINEPKSRKQNKVIAGTWAYHGFESIIWAKKKLLLDRPRRIVHASPPSTHQKSGDFP
jgi:SAM-dependent methyltransferase